MTAVKLIDNGCSFRLSSVSKYGDREEKALVDIVLWGDLARMYAESIKEGMRVFVEGRVKNCSDELPTGKKRYWTEVVANKIEKI
jgi:single-stranded DNA-binding protein